MAATLRAPVRAALASSSRARIVTRHSSRCPRAVSARSATGPSNVEVITFDLDDTLWPTTPVVMAANKAFVDFCQERIPGFPDCAGINEYMKVSLISPKDSLTSRAFIPHASSHHPSYASPIHHPSSRHAGHTNRTRSSLEETRRAPRPALLRRASHRRGLPRGVRARRAGARRRRNRVARYVFFILIYTRAIRLTACCV